MGAHEQARKAVERLAGFFNPDTRMFDPTNPEGTWGDPQHKIDCKEIAEYIAAHTSAPAEDRTPHDLCLGCTMGAGCYGGDVLSSWVLYVRAKGECPSRVAASAPAEVEAALYDALWRVANAAQNADLPMQMCGGSAWDELGAALCNLDRVRKRAALSQPSEAVGGSDALEFPALDLIAIQANEIAATDSRFHMVAQVIRREAAFADAHITALTAKQPSAEVELAHGSLSTLVQCAKDGAKHELAGKPDELTGILADIDSLAEDVRTALTAKQPSGRHPAMQVLDKLAAKQPSADKPSAADARLAAIEQLLAVWLDAQGFDPCGGPTEDSDWAALNAYFIAGGELEPDHPAILASLDTGGGAE